MRKALCEYGLKFLTSEIRTKKFIIKMQLLIKQLKTTKHFDETSKLFNNRYIIILSV